MLSFQKRFICFLLCGVTLLPVLSTVGCATSSSSNSKKQPTNVFSFPKLKKDQTKTGKVKKDPDIPVTMSEAMMMPRNDVL